MSFKNRMDAGRKLAKALAGYKKQRPVILALPRGGVLVAAEIAAAFNAPLDLVLVRKIGVPFQPELAMGAVVDGGSPIIVRNDDVIEIAQIDEATFKAVCEKELTEIERRRQRYPGNRKRAEINAHIAIVVDDGIATGATIRAALRATRLRNPTKLVLAVPVAPTRRHTRLLTCVMKPMISYVLKTMNSSTQSVPTMRISAKFRTRRSWRCLSAFR